ncbi:MAG TPA: DUF2252 family protein [Polyangiaceae bacterium]|nr:DUF2252 family protein [Polyangiaceae bacterium]
MVFGSSSVAPEQWAARQLELDRERTERFPRLFERKVARMSLSPFAFLRGAAPLFYEILADSAELRDGPPGEGWLVGDLHLENFGAFRPERSSDAPAEKRPVTFDLNDFDEAVSGPWRWDVLRLLASLILAGRELGSSGPVVLELSKELLESYVSSAFRGAPVPPQPAPVAALVERVRSRPRQQLLDARTEAKGAHRAFVRGERYAELSPEIVAQLPHAIQRYAERLPPDGRPHAEQLEILDAALRVAGTGSLGVLRVALLTRGKGGLDGGWLFEMKEQPVPSAARLVAPADAAPAETAVEAFRACVAAPPRMLGTTHVGESGMVVRRLSPQEDKLALRELDAKSLPPLVRYLGALAGSAHARGSSSQVPAPWSERDCADMVHRAAKVAWLHEAIYLEWCLRLHGEPPSAAPDVLQGP